MPAGQERTNIEKSISAYYSSLSDEEALEKAQWGEFALREFPSESYLSAGETGLQSDSAARGEDIPVVPKQSLARLRTRGKGAYGDGLRSVSTGRLGYCGKLKVRILRIPSILKSCPQQKAVLPRILPRPVERRN